MMFLRIGVRAFVLAALFWLWGAFSYGTPTTEQITIVVINAFLASLLLSISEAQNTVK